MKSTESPKDDGFANPDVDLHLLTLTHSSYRSRRREERRKDEKRPENAEQHDREGTSVNSMAGR